MATDLEAHTPPLFSLFSPPRLSSVIHGTPKAGQGGSTSRGWSSRHAGPGLSRAEHAGTCSPLQGRGQRPERGLLENPRRLPRATAERSGAVQALSSPAARYWLVAVGARWSRSPQHCFPRSPGSGALGVRPRAGRAALGPPGDGYSSGCQYAPLEGGPCDP